MSITRRNFIQRGTAACASLAAASSMPAWAAPSTASRVTALPEDPHGPMIFGVQLFMLNAQAAKDLPATFATIHAAGFPQVELYPVAYNRTAAELRRQISDAGLGCVSGHFNYDGLEKQVEYAHNAGLKYMVCPMLPRDQWTSLDGFRKAAALFTRTGELARQAGMTFAYHNHSYDFRPMEGSYGFAEIMKNTSAETVKLEFDLFWLTQAGKDPAAMLRDYRDRAVLLHMKGRRAGAAPGFTMESGEGSEALLSKGSIDYAPLLRQAKAQGIRYAFLDHDSLIGTAESDLRDAHDYLTGLHV